jgi:hypothetical protein
MAKPQMNVHVSSSDFKNLLAAQQQSLGELTSIKKLIELSRDHEKLQKATGGADSQKIQEEILSQLKEQTKNSRKYYKTQAEFQAEWDKEAKDIAAMVKGMKSVKTLGEKFKDSVSGVKEKYGIANGGLKRTVLGAMNVGGIFNKTLDRDKFVEQQKALGAKAMPNESSADFKKRLKEDYEGARQSKNKITDNEKAIQAHMAKAGTTDEEFLKGESPEFAALLEKRQEHTEELGKYDRSTRQFSPDKKNAELAGLLPQQQFQPAAGISNPVAGLGATAAKEPSATATAAESVQGAEAAEEGQREAEKETELLSKIEENTRGGEGKADEVKEEKKPEGGGLLDTIMSFLGEGLMQAFKFLFNPKTILKSLGKIFAIGMIVGALFEGIMDGFDEFMETGDIGKAIVAGLAGIVDFLTFGLFDKDAIKDVIGNIGGWINDHLIQPYLDMWKWIGKSLMSVLESIGIPEITLLDNKITGKVSVGPWYPFKSDGSGEGDKKPEAATPPQEGNVVEQKSAENADAAATPAANNNTNVVNAPVTTNNSTTQVIKSPIRNQESSVSSYVAKRYA